MCASNEMYIYIGVNQPRFLFLQSKNKRAATLPFVLDAPLDPDKGKLLVCRLALKVTKLQSVCSCLAFYKKGNSVFEIDSFKKIILYLTSIAKEVVAHSS